MIKTTTMLMGRSLFREFIHYTKPDYIFAPHHERIVETIQKVIEGLIRFLFIGVPPRHGKSEIASVRLPAFHLGIRPDKNIIHIAHSADLTNEFSRQVRLEVRDNPRYHDIFPHIRLDKERSKISDWKIDRYGGGFRSVGVNGAVTGYGADMMIIDDPHKEGDINSPKVLEDIFFWFSTAARTRLAPGAPIVFPMTRWGRLDLIGQLLALSAVDPNADQWTELVFPALAEAGDLLGRKPGEALWRERFDEDALLSIKALDDVLFQALFQNNPSGADTALFEREYFRHYMDQPDLEWFWAFDLATSEKESGDYTVGVRMAYDAENKVLYCSHVVRRRMELPKVLRWLRAISYVFRDEKLVFPKHVAELLVVQLLKKKLPKGLIEQIDQKGDKKERAGVLSSISSNGRFFIRYATDAELFIREHVEFPQVKHDDCVDASSVATHYLELEKEFSIAILEAEQNNQREQDSWLV